MADPLVISALSKKRAEVDGEIRKLQKRLGELRSDLASIDHAIRIFDPSASPELILPKFKRPAPEYFRRGAFSREVLETLRSADKGLTPREIAERVAAKHQLSADTTESMNMFIQRVRTVLTSHKEALVCKQVGAAFEWRVAEAPAAGAL
jgi:hypothetical protein